MDDDIRVKLKGLLSQASSMISEASELLRDPAATALSYADKLKAILSKYGKIRKLAYDLDVDVRTIRRWFEGTQPSEKNKQKIDILYQKYFGEN